MAKIVVFGGGSGVGLAAAKLLAARGDEVIDSGFMTGTVLCVDGGLPHSSL